MFSVFFLTVQYFSSAEFSIKFASGPAKLDAFVNLISGTVCKPTDITVALHAFRDRILCLKRKLKGFNKIKVFLSGDL
jgi:hypothetical protein